MFEELTPEGIRREMTERMGTELDTREGSYTGDMLGAAAYEIWKVYQSLNALIPMAFVDETSGEYIDKRCAEYGILRKPGTKARAVVTITGSDGTVIPEGTTLLTAEGLEFNAVSTAVIAGGSALAAVESASHGTVYNVAAGAIRMISMAIPGIKGVVSAAAQGGTDPETDKDLMERLRRRLQNPATSGNAEHYRQWALEVSGVGAAKVTPLWNGPGTVKILIVDQDRQPAAEGIVSACAEHLETQRPVGAAVTVLSAEGLAVDINAVVRLEKNASAEAVKTKFETSLKAYIDEIAFVKYEVLFNRIAFMLMDIDGVADYTKLTINGNAESVAIGADQVPILGEVTIDVV